LNGHSFFDCDIWRDAIEAKITVVTVWKNMGVVRGIAILCVALNHATLQVARSRAASSNGAEPYGLIERWAFILGVTLPVASVAGFMIVSGYMMSRFSSTGTASRAAVRSIGVKYLFWSVWGFLVIAVITRNFSFGFVLERLRGCYGPFPTYWFFAPLILFSLLCPVLTLLSKQRPFTLLGIFFSIQTLHAILFYGYDSAGLNYLVPLQGSYFMLGCLLAQHSNVVVAKLVPFRTAILTAALLFLAISWFETSYWWKVTGSVFGPAISADRLSVRLFAICIAAWFILRDTKPSWFTAWLDKIGMKSLAVFLLFDFWVWLTIAILWHLPGLVGGHGVSRLPVAPSYMGHSAWIPLYCLIGISGPLIVAYLVERLLGKRWRVVLFG
jgi:hypothetical protein